MKAATIDTTGKYSFSKIISPDKRYLPCRRVLTVYVHQGEAILEIKNPSGLELERIKEGEGFVLTPGVKYRLLEVSPLIAFMASSEITSGKPVIEIVDDGFTQKENEITGYKIIRNVKVVKKPWGSELWIIWIKDCYVLKKIAMKEGEQSSLQFHRKKLETNFLIEGEADIVKGYVLGAGVNEEEARRNISGVNWENYKQRMTVGMHWTTLPGDVHRITAVKDCVSYEASTTELDDVIRLRDNFGRGSGRIIGEHKK